MVRPGKDAVRSAPRLRWQFSLRGLLLVFLGVGLVSFPAANFGPVGSLVTAALAFVVLLLIAFRVARFSLLEGLLVIAVLGILGSMLLPAVQTTRPASRRMQCQNSLKQLGLALHNYNVDHGSFPPAYIADEVGRPMHSWRVLILPYIEEQNLYDAYNFDEPWDGRNNRLLHDRMPLIFGCPSDKSNSGGANVQTSYVAVVGARTMWPHKECRKLDEVKDGTSNTILLVEVHNSGIHWMEPRDLDFETSSSTINVGPSGRTISSGHTGGANVAFADGSVHFLSEEIGGMVMQSLLTIDGQEGVSVGAW